MILLSLSTPHNLYIDLNLIQSKHVVQNQYYLTFAALTLHLTPPSGSWNLACYNNDWHFFSTSSRSVNTKDATNTTNRLRDLRDLMKQSNLTATIVPIDELQRLAWISGFTGSYGKAIITLTKVMTLTKKW